MDVLIRCCLKKSVLKNPVFQGFFFSDLDKSSTLYTFQIDFNYTSSNIMHVLV